MLWNVYRTWAEKGKQVVGRFDFRFFSLLYWSTVSVYTLIWMLHIYKSLQIMKWSGHQVCWWNKLLNRGLCRWQCRFWKAGIYSEFNYRPSLILLKKLLSLEKHFTIATHADLSLQVWLSSSFHSLFWYVSSTNHHTRAWQGDHPYRSVSASLLRCHRCPYPRDLVAEGRSAGFSHGRIPYHQWWYVADQWCTAFRCRAVWLHR